MSRTHHKGVGHPAKNASERRGACRYSVLAPDAWLGWWEAGSFVNTPVRIVDLSSGGCMVELSELPRRSQEEHVWFLPAVQSPAEWTEGVVVALRNPSRRKCLVAISFVTPFAYAAFKNLVYGIENLSRVSSTETLEHERNDFWR
jgi:hypothetical protein